MAELELTVVGPIEVAPNRALEYGIRVRSWTHRKAGLVSLFVAPQYYAEASRWYAASNSEREPGNLISIVTRR